MPYTSVRRATALAIQMPDRPGLLAEALGQAKGAGVNLLHGTALGIEGTARFYVVPEQLDALKSALSGAGVQPREFPVLIFEGDDQPGALVDIAQKIADAGINILGCSASAIAGRYIAVFAFQPEDFEKVAALFGA